jgi:hypothetical protein
LIDTFVPFFVFFCWGFFCRGFFCWGFFCWGFFCLYWDFYRSFF